MSDIGSHWMDCIEYVTGLKITRVCAGLATFHPIRKKPLKGSDTFAGKLLTSEDYEDVKIQTEDYAGVLLHFNNGVHGVMTVNQASAGRKCRFSFEIDGSKMPGFGGSDSMDWRAFVETLMEKGFQGPYEIKASMSVKRYRISVPYRSISQKIIILSLKKEVGEGRALERFYPLSPLASKELFFLKGFDRKDRKMYSYPCPAKQKRATLGSDPSRDSRMRLRRISVWGSLIL